MATGQGSQEARPTGVKARGKGKPQAAKRSGDHNRVRRAQYRSDETVRDAARTRARENYRKQHPKSQSPLATGLLQDPVEREVFSAGMEHPQVAECFTVPEAAKALGKSPMTVKRWIEQGMIPETVLKDCIHGYNQYSVGELQLIANALAKHEAEFSYLNQNHTAVIHEMLQAVEGYRKSNI